MTPDDFRAIAYFGVAALFGGAVIREVMHLRTGRPR